MPCGGADPKGRTPFNNVPYRVCFFSPDPPHGKGIDIGRYKARSLPVAPSINESKCVIGKAIIL